MITTLENREFEEYLESLDFINEKFKLDAIQDWIDRNIYNNHIVKNECDCNCDCE